MFPSTPAKNGLYIASTAILGAADECRRIAESMSGNESTGKNAYLSAARLLDQLAIMIREHGDE